MTPDLDTTLPAAMADLNVPGCAVAVIRAGRVAEVRCYGEADRASGERVGRDTLFSLQSVSKSIAAWAAMILVEQGRLDLDAPISRYLTRWTLPPSPFDLDQVTARRLLTHYAGVTVAGFRGVELDREGFTLLDAMTGRLPPPNPEQVRHYAYWNLPEDDDQVTVTHAPGSGFRYANPGFAIVELAIEDITGETYAAFVEANVFRPLGMRAARFGRAPDGRGARPHDRDGRPVQDYRWLSGAAAGVYATIEDLAAFVCAATAAAGAPAGRGVVSPAALGRMWTGYGPADQSTGMPFEAGLGHVVLRSGGVLNVHHSGGSIGWRSIFSVFPALGEGVCMLMNGEAANELWIPVVRAWRDAVAAGADGRRAG